MRMQATARNADRSCTQSTLSILVANHSQVSQLPVLAVKPFTISSSIDLLYLLYYFFA